MRGTPSLLAVFFFPCFFLSFLFVTYVLKWADAGQILTVGGEAGLALVTGDADGC